VEPVRKSRYRYRGSDHRRRAQRHMSKDKLIDSYNKSQEKALDKKTSEEAAADEQ